MAETRKPLSYETHPNGISFDIRGMRVRGALYDERRIIDVSGDEESIDRLRRGLDRLEAEAEARGYQRAIDALRPIRDALNDTLHEDEVVDPIGCLETLLIQMNGVLLASAQTAIRSGESTEYTAENQAVAERLLLSKVAMRTCWCGSEFEAIEGEPLRCAGGHFPVVSERSGEAK